MKKADEILKKFEQLEIGQGDGSLYSGFVDVVPVTLREDDKHPLATIADPGRVRVCANFSEGMCDIGCDAEGVIIESQCPFIPLFRQPQCACYKAGEFVI